MTKNRIALFSPAVDDFREWYILTSLFHSQLKEDYEITLFAREAKGEAVPFHEFTWRNLKQPYDLIIYNFSRGEDFAYMAPFLLIYPGLVILRDVSFTESIWRMHTLDGTESDFVKEMAYCYGKEGILLGNLMWRGMWGEQLERKFPMFKLLADSSISVCGFDPWIIEKIKKEAAADHYSLLPAPFFFPASNKKKSLSFITLFSQAYPLQIDVVLKTLREASASGMKLHLAVITDDENQKEMDGLIKSNRLEGTAEAVVPASPAEIDGLLAGSQVLLFIEDPAAPVEILPVMAAASAGCAVVLTDSFARLNMPAAAFTKFRFREKAKGLLGIIKSLNEKPESLSRFSEADGDYFLPKTDASAKGSNSKIVNPAFSAVFKETVHSALKMVRQHKYPVGYPDHLHDFQKRLASSMKEKLSDFPESKDIDKTIQFVIGQD